jgi:hypothetical protein
MVLWGPWPAWQTVAARSTLSNLRLMQLFAQKGELLNDLLLVEMGVLLVVLGRRFYAGWRSHAQQITFGLAAASAAQLVVRVVWQKIASTPPRSQEEYQRISGLQDKLFNANSIVYLLVIVGWIVCLWINEPGSNTAAAGPAEALVSGTTIPRADGK